MLTSSQKGLTLVEMLVVLVISSLVATLLIQGTGFFLNSYQRVLKRQNDFGQEAMVLDWFRESVTGLVASQDEPFGFSGSEHRLQGFTLQPVQGMSGRLTSQQWRLEENNQYYELWLEEGSLQPMLITRWLADSATLNYRGQQGQWHKQWPVDGVPTGGLPLRIKVSLSMIDERDAKEIYASVAIRRTPRLDYRDSL